MNPLTQQKIRISSILVMVFQEKPRQGRAGAQSQGGKKSSPTEEGAGRLRAIRQLCFSPIACVEEFGFVALKRRWSDDQRPRRLLAARRSLDRISALRAAELTSAPMIVADGIASCSSS